MSTTGAGWYESAVIWKARAESAEAEIERLRAGLELISEAGPVHGGAWCAALARGYLFDLDFDAYPETGRSEADLSN